LNAPTWITFDSAGNLYISDRDNNAVRRVDTNGIITTVERGSTGSGTAGPGRHGKLDDPAGLAFGPRGELNVADSNHARIRTIAPDGSIITIAGNGHAGYSGDGGPALAARMSNPEGVATDANGNVFVSDEDNLVIREIDTAGQITTVAGTGHAGCPVDGALASQSLFSDPANVVIAPDGRLYISDGTCGSIYVVDPDGTIHTFATR
jgi:sugar lactone lactonase YvrE